MYSSIMEHIFQIKPGILIKTDRCHCFAQGFFSTIHIITGRNGFLLPLHHCVGISALHLDEVSELAEGLLQVSFFGVRGEDRQVPGVNDGGGKYGQASQLQVAQSQEGSWPHHLFQTGLSKAAETAHFHEVQLPIGQVERRRRTCVEGTGRH